MNIKVQIIGMISSSSIAESKNLDFARDNPLTFIAYSGKMKEAVLDKFVSGDCQHTIGLSVYNGPVRDGEWHEPLVQNAVFNSPVKMMEQVDTNTLVDDLIGRLNNDSHVDDNKKAELAKLLIGYYQ
jgi:hypothetical protein